MQTGNGRDYSGRGPTESCIKKPDIVAPGSNIISCQPVSSTPYGLYGYSYDTISMETVSQPQRYLYVNSGSQRLHCPASATETYLSNREVKIQLKKQQLISAMTIPARAGE